MHIQQPLHLLLQLGDLLFDPFDLQQRRVGMKLRFRPLQEFLQNILMVIGDNPEGFHKRAFKNIFRNCFALRAVLFPILG